MATWDLSTTRHHILICNGSSCKNAGAEELTQSIRKEITTNGLDSLIHTTRTLCNGRCHDKCVVISYPDGNWYKDMTPEDAPQFIDGLVSGNGMDAKLSHTFNEIGFQALKTTVTGKKKDEDIVKRVSKTF